MLLFVNLEILFIVTSVFNISGRGTVVTGTVKGDVNVGDQVEIIDDENENIFEDKITITGIEMFRKHCESATEGDNVGLWLRGINKDDISIGLKIVIRV